jgi:hypothetical protein
MFCGMTRAYQRILPLGWSDCSPTADVPTTNVQLDTCDLKESWSGFKRDLSLFFEYGPINHQQHYCWCKDAMWSRSTTYILDHIPKLHYTLQILHSRASTIYMRMAFLLQCNLYWCRRPDSPHWEAQILNISYFSHNN